MAIIRKGRHDKWQDIINTKYPSDFAKFLRVKVVSKSFLTKIWIKYNMMLENNKTTTCCNSWCTSIFQGSYNAVYLYLNIYNDISAPDDYCLGNS